VNSPILPILTIKLVATATFLKRPEKGVKSVIYDQISTIWKGGEKGVKSVIYDQISTIWWKCGENRSGGSRDSFAQ